MQFGKTHRKTSASSKSKAALANSGRLVWSFDGNSLKKPLVHNMNFIFAVRLGGVWLQQNAGVCQEYSQLITQSAWDCLEQIGMDWTRMD